jgi:hypothetical protein
MTSLKVHYFVDEAGDSTLFSRKGRAIVGEGGCSRNFIIGLLEVEDPETLSEGLLSLRKEFLNDPYFKSVPSFQPEARKTALAFHAKDDLPEVRREMFRFLKDAEGLSFYAVVRDKLKVLEYVRQRSERDPSYRYRPDELYDFLIRGLFRDRLHQGDEYNIVFAKRGKADRTIALLESLKRARQRFFQKWNIESKSQINVIASYPAHDVTLQAADYFNWALQRFYERQEDRYLEYLWPSMRLVHDIDDTREARYGRYYTQKKPLTLSMIEGR